MISFDVITLFPEIIEIYFQYGVLSRAVRNKLIEVTTYQLRDFASDLRVDRPLFGGGKGMLFRPEPLDAVLKECLEKHPHSLVIYLTPQGVPLTNRLARSLSRESGLILVSSRYEGIDARWVHRRVDLEISTGDYVLTGGELPALAVIDAVSRFIPGMIESESVEEESFEDGLLEYEHFTEPLVYKGEEIPSVLRSGHHKKISDFRFWSSLKKTYFNRSDLFRDFIFPVKDPLSKDPVRFLKKKNQQVESYLKLIQKISKEWINVRRAQKR